MFENGISLSNGDSTQNPWTAPPVQLQQECRSYKRRWYILLLFCAVACMNGTVWNTWGPIGVSAEWTLGWTNENIAIVSICACISGTLATPVCSWLLEVKGIRWSLLVTVFFLALGTGMRIFTLGMPAFTILAYLCAIIDGFGATIVMSGGPCLSAVWFPPNERTTATAIATVATYLGNSAGFLLGPLVMGDVDCPNYYATPRPRWEMSMSLPENTTTSHNTTLVCFEESRDQLRKLMWIEAGVSLGLLVLTMIYYPAKPPKPPSISATQDRTCFFSGMVEAARHGPIWLLSIPFATAAGYYFCWTSVLDLNLKSIGIPEEEAGMLGFYGTLVGCAAGTLASVFMDVVARKERWVLLGVFVTCTGFSLWFSAICMQWIPFSKAEIYITVIGIGATLCGAVPLFFEMACETVYPIPEAVTTGMLTMWNNLSVVLFFIVFYVPGIGSMWMNWTLVASCAVSIPLLIMFPEKYARLDVDQQNSGTEMTSQWPKMTSQGEKHQSEKGTDPETGLEINRTDLNMNESGIKCRVRKVMDSLGLMKDQ